MLFKNGKIKGDFCARKSKEIASIMKMRSTPKVSKCIRKCVLAIIYSNSFSHCKVDQKKTVAISQMFSHVQLHLHWMHLLNDRICRYTYSINTTLCDQDRWTAPHTKAMDTFR